MSITEPREMNKSACKWQGRPSRGIPTPSGYLYLTRHLPRNITLTWVSNPATDERVRTRKTGGKETQLYITMIKCSGLGGRKRHAFKINCSGRIRRRPEKEPRPRLRPCLRQSPPRPRTTTQAGGSLPRRWLPDRARARGGRVEPLDFSQGGFIFVREAIPLADPLQIHDVVRSKHGEAPPDAVM